MREARSGTGTMGAGGFYDVLGVPRDASDDDIRKAFRKIARDCHPDVAGDDADKAESFKRARAAYEVLSDPERRKAHDRETAPRRRRQKGSDGAFFRAFYRRASEGARAPEAPVGPEDLFRDFGFGAGDRPRARVRPGAKAPQRGDDLCIDVDVDEATATSGGRVRASYQRFLPERGAHDMGFGSDVRLQDDAQDLLVPPNTRHLAIRRFPGLGHAGPYGGEAGELVVRFRVQATPKAAATPSELGLDLPLRDALLGSRRMVDTPAGRVRLVIPPCTSGGARFRLAGKGTVQPGGGRADAIVTVRIVVPETLDAATLALATALPPSEEA